MRKYALVGAGGRAGMFRNAFTNLFKDKAKLLAVCDPNSGRLKLMIQELADAGIQAKPYPAESFDAMLKEIKPDVVIVCSPDYTHDDYICRSLLAGCDVITEKPMTIDETRCRRILDTVESTQRQVRVTFNYRYSPPRSQVKELLMSGVIGTILSVNFHWFLDTNHGADYFRRWHRNKANSGGLMVHKATHHFDLVNWWIGAVPKTVYAQGGRLFYTPEQASRYGLENRGKRCTECPVSDRCNFYLNLSCYETLRKLYLENESYDGYYRDRCVFSDEIDIEDNMNVIVQYDSGAFLNYSLNAFLPWEGYRIEFNGTKGRLEHFCQESSYINGDGTVQGALLPEQTTIRIFPHFQTPYAVPVRSGEGAHGGGDVVMLKDLFCADSDDPLRRAANHIQGAYSILIGIAANHSLACGGKKIEVSNLLKIKDHPNYPQNQTEGRIPFVKNVEYSFGNKKGFANDLSSPSRRPANPSQHQSQGIQ